MTITAIRPAHEYTVTLSDDSGGDTTITITAQTGTEAEQDAEAERLADEGAEAWAREGEWGDDGACITVYVDMEDEHSEFPRRWVEVDIEPDHDRLIEQAGGDTSCDHEWSSEGEGGADENPGVWATGGTSMQFRSHCEHCGLIRVEETTGSQRNPGEHDTVRYELPDDDADAR